MINEYDDVGEREKVARLSRFEVYDVTLKFEENVENGQNKGLALMNAIREVSPKVHERISGSEHDCSTNNLVGPLWKEIV